MNFRVTLAVFICKLSIKLLRLFNRGGTSLPGKIALFIHKDILKYLSKDVFTIFVTGTNGKTTTCRIIKKGLEDNKSDYFSNKTGANLFKGIVTAFCQNSNWKGVCKHKIALIECDEADLRNVTKHVKAGVICVTNIFEDQLDRFGSVENVVLLIKEAIDNSSDALLVLNADCEHTISLGKSVPNKSYFFGINNSETSDNIRKQVSIEKVVALKEDTSEVLINILDKQYETSVNLPGLYNVYNAVCAACVLQILDIPHESILSALSQFQSGFGRMESFSIRNVDTTMILVKNSIGFNQTLGYLELIDKKFNLILVLNNRAADGKDFSWLEDIDFELFKTIDKKIDKIYLSGMLKDTFFEILKNNGFDTNKILLQDDLYKLTETALNEKLPIYILPTYTAMLDLRKMLSKKYSLPRFYEK